MRKRGVKPIFDTALLDQLVELAHGLQPPNWRSRYFGHPAARVLIVGDRLRVFIPWGAA